MQSNVSMLGHNRLCWPPVPGQHHVLAGTHVVCMQILIDASLLTTTHISTEKSAAQKLRPYQDLD